MRKLFFAVFVVAAMHCNFEATVFRRVRMALVVVTAAAAIQGTPDQNPPPLANAGVDQTVRAGTVVTLDGSNSTDPNGSIASYAWAQTDRNGRNDFEFSHRESHLHSTVCRGQAVHP